MISTRSDRLFDKSRKLIPGGVNSPVRAMSAVHRNPLFIERAKGARIHDVDGNAFIDYIGSWGPMIVGHAHDEVIDAIRRAASYGTSFGAPTAAEYTLAEMVCEAVPSVEMVRLVNSGTEATMSALRLARAATGRDKILKFEGCYHGHFDGLLVAAGSGATTLGIPNSPGVPADFARNTLLARYNDLDDVREKVAAHRDDLAAIIVEPVAGNMGCIAPTPGFLAGLRDLCDEHGMVLIFDEVMSGFRVAYGGAQERFAVLPDLTCLGKVIGGGLPVGAYGGKRELMEWIAPAGPVYQAGTLSGNPLATAAGIATLKILEESGTYERLEEISERIATGIMQAASDAGITTHTNQVGAMFSTFFQSGPVTNYDDAKNSDTEQFARFWNAMLTHGVLLPPSQFEAAFPSLAHDDECIEITINAANAAFAELGE
jgi:glutamate-1-semialdehyde 2,1-aminomutase